MFELGNIPSHSLGKVASYHARCVRHSIVNFEPLMLPLLTPTEAPCQARRRAREYCDADSCCMSKRELRLEGSIREYLRMPMPPGSSIADRGKSIGYLSQRLAKALRLWPCATLYRPSQRMQDGSALTAPRVTLQGGHRKHFDHACLAFGSRVSVQ